MKRKILVVSAHPDDEILGVGGTLIRHRDAGDEISWLIITRMDEEDGFSRERIATRQAEIEKVAGQLGMRVFQLDYAAMSLSSADIITMVPKISKVITEVEPERIYTLNRSDAHSDHRITFQSVMACTKSFRYPYIKDVFMYECISETEMAPALAENVFLPNCYVNVSEQMDEKIALANIYESEFGEHPFPRSERNMRALATFRGATCGHEYAEAFQIIKSIRDERL